MEGFKKFILRGNVVDLAVGIAIGAAFNDIVNTLVKGIITPLVGAIFQAPDFSTFKVSAGGSTFAIGDVINAAVTFLIIALVIYFLIVLPMNKLTDMLKRRQKPADPANKKCPECLSEIPIKAKRCAYCGEPQPA
ncbi:large conductance mechanosensitive channel protein MscL [Candidatus Kaiserbacteria bacterium]|nr:large conductance mechanosensitive channel protein MscL [Candidatus Kaiserbacteria bacterium]